MPHAQASGFPSPCSDRGGQAPALRKKTGPFTVGRGPVPRYATIAGDRPPHYGKKRFHKSLNAAGTGPRAVVKNNAALSRRAGPSHATRACERVPLAMQRSRGTGNRDTKKNGFINRSTPRGQAPALRKKTGPFTVGRGPVPRHATTAGDRPPHYEKKRAPSP